VGCNRPRVGGEIAEFETLKMRGEESGKERSGEEWRMKNGKKKLGGNRGKWG
jgi:hypothetical protein